MNDLKNYLIYVLTHKLWWLCVGIFFVGKLDERYPGWWWSFIVSMCIVVFIIPHPDSVQTQQRPAKEKT